MEGGSTWRQRSPRYRKEKVKHVDWEQGCFLRLISLLAYRTPIYPNIPGGCPRPC